MGQLSTEEPRSEEEPNNDLSHINRIHQNSGTQTGIVTSSSVRTRTVAETTTGLNTVVNLSSRELTEGEVALLSKGLKFCPTPSDLDRYNLRKDINDFIRRIRLKEYFFQGDNVGGDFRTFRLFVIDLHGVRTGVGRLLLRRTLRL